MDLDMPAVVFVDPVPGEACWVCNLDPCPRCGWCECWPSDPCDCAGED